MIVEINDKIRSIINDMPYNKTVKNNALKIYAALYLLSKRKNKKGYFPVPSTYLASINKRYYRIIKYFEHVKLIESLKRAHQDADDIFNTRYTKYYDKTKGICMKYRFLLPISGDSIDINFTISKHLRWYQVIQDSLLEFGYDDIKISRDTFGRRVHHNAIMNYKKEFKGYYTIDSISSQPRLLWLDMKKKGIIDKEYNDIFENDKDFYLEVQYKLHLKQRNEAKDLFMYWINSNGYVPNFNIHKLFPVVSKYIKEIKRGNYKDMGSKLQRMESKIWIDNILNGIPTDFALPVHDCVIVKEEDVDKVLQYCIEMYPELKFKKQRL